MIQTINQEELLDDLYNVFEPFEVLPAGDKRYVDCKEVRGNEDITLMGRRMRRSRINTCQLYSGHRGGGKSTELLKLKAYLEDHNFFVVYFNADAEDIDTEDTQYTDILLACTRQLLKTLNEVDSQPLLNWLKNCWDDLKDVMNTKIEIDKISIKSGELPNLFASLTADLRAIPTQRSKIREKVNPHTVTLLKALNEFINNAKNSLPNNKQKLAIIVDSLDRIVPILRDKDTGKTNYDEIFIDRSEQLKGLDCHVVYTIPLSMIYSHRADDIKVTYSDPQTLPMIMVKNKDGSINEKGMNKIKEIIERRVKQILPDLTSEKLESEIFDSRESLEKVCLNSGGHVRNLMLLIQSAINQIDVLPISRREVQITLSDEKDVYRRAVNSDQWSILAQVAQTKTIKNNSDYRSLLFNRCILEYCEFSEESGNEGRNPWYDVHPLITELSQFQEVKENIDTDENNV